MFKRIFSFVVVFLMLLMCLVPLGYSAGKGNNFHGADANSILNYIFNVQGDFAAVTADSVTLNTPLEGTVQLPLNSFMLGSGANMTTSSTPAFENVNNINAIKWASGVATPVMATFKVPNDYLSGGAFRVFADQSNTSTKCGIGFSVYVNSSGTAWDSAVTTQTPVVLTGTSGTPVALVLSVATDFATLAAGKEVTVLLWRDGTGSPTADLEAYYAEFYYNRK